MANLVWVYANIAPAEPRASPGNVKRQYLSSVSAKARRTVAAIMRTLPNVMIHFWLTQCATGPVKHMSSAATPMGILALHRALEKRNRHPKCEMEKTYM